MTRRGSLLDRATQIAAEAHRGQSDKLGHPYYQHCQRVASAVTTEEEKVVAYLHDVIEKGPSQIVDRLRSEGFPARVLAAIEALTRRSGEDDETFVRRAIADPLARAVKRADLEDNLRQAKEAGADTAKYESGLAILARQ